MAVRFLQNLQSRNLLMHLRRLVVDEDAPFVAWPECHALGLIDFCKPNHRLHIERRIDLWNCVFQLQTLSWDVRGERMIDTPRDHFKSAGASGLSSFLLVDDLLSGLPRRTLLLDPACHETRSP